MSFLEGQGNATRAMYKVQALHGNSMATHRIADPLAAFVHLDENEDLKWEYNYAVVAAVSGCIAILAEGWPTYEWWPDECIMGLLVNGAEYYGLQGNIKAICETPSWLRSVLCGPL